MRDARNASESLPGGAMDHVGRLRHRAMRPYPPQPMLKNILPLMMVGLLVCGCANKSGGGGNNKKSAKEKEVGFTPLFNGSDLTGWTYGKDANGALRKAGNGYQV